MRYGLQQLLDGAVRAFVLALERWDFEAAERYVSLAFYLDQVQEAAP